VAGRSRDAPGLASRQPGGMRVDVHAHLFPALYLDLLDDLRGDGGAGTQGVRALGGGDSEREMRMRLGAMDAVGVDVQLLSTCPQGPYTGDPTAAVEAARCANIALAHTAAQHPERLRALATLPLPHILASIDELNRAMEQDGMPGAAVGTSILGRPLGHPDFDPLFAALNRRKAVLFVHPVGDAAGSPVALGERVRANDACARVCRRWPAVADARDRRRATSGAGAPGCTVPRARPPRRQPRSCGANYRRTPGSGGAAPRYVGASGRPVAMRLARARHAARPDYFRRIGRDLG